MSEVAICRVVSYSPFRNIAALRIIEVFFIFLLEWSACNSDDDTRLSAFSANCLSLVGIKRKGVHAIISASESLAKRTHYSFAVVLTDKCINMYI